MPKERTQHSGFLLSSFRNIRLDLLSTLALQHIPQFLGKHLFVELDPL